MKLAISLLNRNGLTDSIECVDSLLASDFVDYNIYLLDNGSNSAKEYHELKNKYKAHNNIIVNHLPANLGFTGGNNLNIKLIMDAGVSEYIMLLNNDCKVDKEFLSNFIKQIESIHKPGIFGPIIKGYDGSVQAAGSSVNLRTGSNKRSKSIIGTHQIVDYVTGSCMIISKEIIQKTGLLDDRFFAYREESDYCMRAKEKGYNTFVVNTDGIYHKEESAQRKIKPYYTYLMFRNRLLFLKKHANFLQKICSWLFLLAYGVLIFPKKFGINNYKYLFKAIGDGLLGKYGKQNLT